MIINKYNEFFLARIHVMYLINTYIGNELVVI
jgi:hypothetical protein